MINLLHDTNHFGIVQNLDANESQHNETLPDGDMKDLWNSDPQAWESMSLTDRLEAMRRWHCTGPCGQSSSVLGTRVTLNKTIYEVASELAAIQARYDRLREAAKEAEKIMAKNVYPKPGVSAGHPWFVLRELRAALSERDGE